MSDYYESRANIIKAIGQVCKNHTELLSQIFTNANTPNTHCEVCDRLLFDMNVVGGVGVCPCLRKLDIVPVWKPYIDRDKECEKLYMEHF
jgi:hypothetical protein